MSLTAKWHERFIGLAELVSTWGKDPSTKCGAVIAFPNKHVASIGFNGFPARMSDYDEYYNNREEKYSRIIHAEINALLFAQQPVNGATLYTFPFIPCDRCVVQMIQAGVLNYVAPRPTPDKEERWGEAFKRTRAYVRECGGSLIEL